MTRDQLLDRIATKLGLGSSDEAEPIARAVLQTLGERLSRLEAEELAGALPRGLDADSLLRRHTHGEDLDVEAFIARVASRTKVDRGRGLEETLVVLRAVGEAVGEDALERIRKELPDEFEELFTLPDPIEEPERVHLHPERRTLAEGRPGGGRPLYAARADRAQSQSVARAENPHEETKLSSARGVTQEREGETLAEGKPGSGRPLSEADPDSTTTYSR